MEAPRQPENPQERARRIVNFWRRRGWLSGGSSPIHLHPLDVDKLVELVAAELESGEP